MNELNGPQSVSGRGGPNLLPLAQTPTPLRADAQRNRQRILAAASALIAESGVVGLTMDELAKRAKVGKGTLYRNFTDKSGIASALLDDRVKDMHLGMLAGPPPLGPGAPGMERLRAFVDAYLRHMARNLDLVLLTEGTTPGGRFGREVYPFWRRHVEILVAEAMRTGAEVSADSEAVVPVDEEGPAAAGEEPNTERARIRAEAVMAVLSAAQLEQWLRKEGHDLDRLIPQVQDIVRDIADPA